jgi:hypothetical protein
MAALTVNTEIAATEVYRFSSLRTVNSTEKNALLKRFVKFGIWINPSKQH